MRVASLLAIVLALGCAKSVAHTRWYEPVQQSDGDWISFPKSHDAMQRTWGDSWAEMSASDTEDSFLPTILTSGGKLSDNGVVAVKYGTRLVSEVAEGVVRYLTGNSGDVLGASAEVIRERIEAARSDRDEAD
ncbi:MAG: hypothetical protein ACYSTL_07585 [Planctomycetota bacterium]|jgi:hypothetical protein